MPDVFSLSQARVVPFLSLFHGGEERANFAIQTGAVPPGRREVTMVGDRIIERNVGSMALREEGESTVAMLSFGSLRKDGSIEYPEVPTVAYSEKIHDYLVQPGDILFRGRGYVGADKVAVAAYVDKEVHAAALRRIPLNNSQACFAYNSSLMRIRLQHDGYNDMPEIEPAYLAAYINSATAQRYLTKHTQGGLVSGVAKKDLLGLPVPVPPLAEQRKLVELIRAQAEYAAVSAGLTERYAQLISQTFNHS